MTKEELSKQIDMDKIIVVDDEKTLQISKEKLEGVKDMAVDIEGTLAKGGHIELVQCAYSDKIFIFDVYGVKSKAKDLKNKEEPSSKLYFDMLALIKNMMEDQRICKVFHDGRKDSLALHLFANCCPQNYFDTSGVYLLNKQLSKLLEFSDRLSLNELRPKEEVKKEESGGKKKQGGSEHNGGMIKNEIDDELVNDI
mmetsp:Transcript_664/g.609  ORF Transcript_664/g.609 Transcript_664/m.609 type:complete len:197 (-) Transcript_664:386-976(-)|eukprot:CAMPEP_0114583286 /NCGR_PEP_ID=MMETSP0125-20121206/7059_1 /TAXON_ID=485358 ORGANISM="Aristerostoma sp., Strain ATCC 50986" /NCGR_SAMPLE_ID=MMETSP0125 /ASSEMBLY_ACC=CAM_ASM_000245 /LENGTH=196 /DNA_ID=CAMNT_0001776671 /DNA_START=1425 /DNA_END=2015 /DNA_ORIENTATION=+